MSTTRRYNSKLREERARETRIRVRKSARKLFAANGFSETTVAGIAREAGVSQQTVYAAFGSKGAIVASMLEDMEEAANLSGWVSKIVAEEDPRKQLRIFVSWIRTLFQSGTPILRAAVAARGDPDVDELSERGNNNRRNGTRQLIRSWEAKSMLRPGLEVEEAEEELWLLTSVEQYLLAVDALGWTPDCYERWLGDLLERELLAPLRS